MALRKRVRVILLASIVAAVVVPVGFALSLESETATTPVVLAPPGIVANSVSHAVVVPVPIGINASGRSPDLLGSFSDAGRLMAVGALLFSLAAIVRKTI